MTGLRSLVLVDNRELSGALPSGLTRLAGLEALHTAGTGLCAPSDAGFLAWLEGVPSRRVRPCDAVAVPAAYLTQAVQSREWPVPLVAGEGALLRVFPTAARAGGTMPAARARFYLGGREVHVEDIPATGAPLPVEVDEGDLAASLNARIPGDVVRPGLELVVEVDPDGTLDPALGVARRIPEDGRLAVDVRRMPAFDLTLIPFLSQDAPDSSVVELVAAMAADPAGHELLQETRTLLPIADLAVRAHEPVLTDSRNAYAQFEATAAIRAMEGGTGHYMGMMPDPAGPAGLADQPGRVSFAAPLGPTVAHELGHNLNLGHTPCGDPAWQDPAYPYADGAIGAWGWDAREGGGLTPPDTPDLMGYCEPLWISDYQFTNALRFRLRDERQPAGGGSGQSAAGVGRRRSRRVALSAARLRDRSPAGAARFDGRVPAHGPDRRRHRTVLARLRHARPRRRRRTRELRLRAPGRAGVGGLGRPHAHRAGWIGHAGRSQRPPDGHPAQPPQRAGARHPARSSATDPGRQGGGGGRRRAGPRSAVQPRDPGRGGLASAMTCGLQREEVAAPARVPGWAIEKPKARRRTIQ